MRVPLASRSARRIWTPKRQVGWLCPSCRCQSSLVQASLTSKDSGKPFYITTPIYYVNAAPHIGHVYSSVLADIIKRWQLLRGRNAILCTGTDEHGMKVQQAATKAGSTPMTFCDKGAEQFKLLAGRAEISYDVFMRTTDPRHVEAVQYAWLILREKNLIYTSKHEGWYAVSDETFYPESQVRLVIDPQTGRKHMASMETGKEVEWTSEPNYHFRLSAFRERLLEFYEQNPTWIDPQSRMNKVVQEVTEGLSDLSVSRPYERLSWGVPVPDDSSQTMYVWLDALLNYATAAGYPWPPGKSHEGGWPADCHVIGKDILRFHCIYWPAFLLALEIPLPSKVISHAHWTMNKEKMSKSIGNVVNPFFALDRFGSDVMRFYMAYDGRIANDVDYDNFRIIDRYKKILQGGLGNLASRITKSKSWSVPIIIKQIIDDRQMSELQADPKDAEQWEMLNRQIAQVGKLMDNYNIPYGLHAITQIAVETNRYLQGSAPWYLVSKLENDPVDPRLPRIIFLCAEALRLTGIFLQPFMPNKASELLDMLGVESEKRTLQYAALCADNSYGTPLKHSLMGKGGDQLFPPLINDG